jgi:hypothetical protein
LQETTEVFGKAVESGVRHDLALVAPTAKDDGIVLALALGQESPHQRGLPSAGDSVDEDGGRLAILRPAECAAKLCEFPVSTDEDRLRGTGICTRRSQRRLPDNGENFIRPSTSTWVKIQKGNAELREVRRRIPESGEELLLIGWLLISRCLGARALEGNFPGQGLVDENSH